MAGTEGSGTRLVSIRRDQIVKGLIHNAGEFEFFPKNDREPLKHKVTGSFCVQRDFSGSNLQVRGDGDGTREHDL